MRLFTLTGACNRKTHCETCRDAHGGRAWRESLRVAYELPGNQVDFECPHGIAWGGSDPGFAKRKAQSESRAAIRLPVCEQCPEFDGAKALYVACKVAKSCCGGGTGEVSLISGKCPRQMWDELAGVE